MRSRAQLVLRSCASWALEAGWCSSRALATSTAASPAVELALVQQGLQPWSGYGVGIEKAVTLPASFYTNPAALRLEKQHILYNTWQMVCAESQVQQPGDFLCGTVGDVRYLLVRGQDGQLRAFHNVCRHHAAAVAQGCGNQPSMQFACPYHGWTYDTRGRLVKATRLKGIQDFKASSYGLHPIAVDTWGHFVFLHLQGGAGRAAAQAPAAAAAPSPPSVAEWLGAGGQRLVEVGMSDSSLVHITQREYVLDCNWKVFADNYLDGGYHVPYAHKALSSGLDLSGYTNELHEVLSIQSCAVQQRPAANEQDNMPTSATGSHSSSSSFSSAGQLDRLGGRDAAYAFVFPNLMINRYGPWMDTNLVLPLTGSSVDRCRVIFDYYLDAEALQQAAASSSCDSSNSASNAASTSSSPTSEQAPSGPSAAVIQAALQSKFVKDSLASSHQVQVEDISLCEAVQQGLQEPSYGVGRYAPGPEAPMYHFHSQLYSAIVAGLSAG